MSGRHPSRGRAPLAVSIDRSRNPFRFPSSGSRSLTRIHQSDDRSAPALYNPSMAPPKWIRPQLSRLATKAPSGLQWIHEIKLDVRQRGCGRRIFVGPVEAGSRQQLNGAIGDPRRHAIADRRLKALVIRAMPLAAPPPKETRFGGKLALLRVHWVRPELVAEIAYLSWADDGLLCHTVFVASREDTPASEVRREKPA
jgi:ATP-dependent DNA ligase